MDKEKCPSCGQLIKPGGSKVFEGFMANLFIQVVKLSSDRKISFKKRYDDKHSSVVEEFCNDVVLSADLRGIPNFATKYTRVHDLKHWGLLEQRSEWWHQGIYQLTKKAKEFLAGDMRIPKEAIVKGGNVLSYSDETISLREALKDHWNEIADWINDWRRGSVQGELF